MASSTSSTHDQGASYHNTGSGSMNVNNGNGIFYSASGSSNQTIHHYSNSSKPEPRNDRQECLESLAYPGITQRSREVKDPAEATCEWAFEHEAYKRWRVSTGNSLLWIKGHAGSGKSTLLKHLLEAITDSVGKDQDHIILSYFFHGRGERLQKSWAGLLRSFCHQLLEKRPGAMPTLPQETRSMNESICQPNWEWTENELSKALHRGLQTASATTCIWIFVDALDEGGEDSAYDTVEYFKSIIDQTSQNSTVRVCFSCRYYLPNMKSPVVSTIRMEDGNTNDIHLAAQRSLAENDVPDAEALSRYIADNASGIFLWAILVVKRILRERRNLPLGDMNKMKEQIRRLETLSDVYKDIIDRIKEQAAELRAESLGIFRWVCLSQHSLDLAEFWEAVTADVDFDKGTRARVTYRRPGTSPALNGESLPEYISQRTFGLVEVITRGGFRQIVQCIHQSVKDHMLQDGLASLQKLSVVRSSTQSQGVGCSYYRMARICLKELSEHYELQRVINHHGPQYPIASPPRYTFFTHCRVAWMYYAKLSEGLRCAEVEFLSYLESKPEEFLQYLLLADAQLPMSVFPPFSPATRNSLGRYRQVDLRDHRNRDQHPLSAKPLHFVFRYGLRQSLKLVEQRVLDQTYTRLIPRSWSPCNTRDSDGNTPLILAVFGGHDDAVQLLLSQPRIDLNLQNVFGDTALILAPGSGHIAVAKRLLRQKDINVNVQNDLGYTALSEAARHGMGTVVADLLGREGVQINWKDSHLRTPLFCALEYGHDDIAMLLLERGAELWSEYRLGLTPLLLACRGGCRAVVRYLLQTSRVDVNIRIEFGHATPLNLAASGGHWGIVKDLLLTGQINQQGKDQAISYACQSSNSEIIQLLWSYGARLHESIYSSVDRENSIPSGITRRLMEATKGRSDEKEYKDVLLSAYANFPRKNHPRRRLGCRGGAPRSKVLPSFEGEIRELLQGGADANYTYGKYNRKGFLRPVEPEDMFIDSMANLAINDEFLAKILREERGEMVTRARNEEVNE